MFETQKYELLAGYHFNRLGLQHSFYLWLNLLVLLASLGAPWSKNVSAINRNTNKPIF